MTRTVRKLLAATALAACLAIPGAATSQEPAQTASADRQASALADYDAFLDILRTDYSGFATKTEGDRAQEFERLAAEARAAIEADPGQVDARMLELVRWFEDNHLYVKRVSGTAAPAANGSADALDLEALRTQGRFIDAARVEKGLANAQGLAGEWATTDGVYTLAIIPDPDAPDKLVAVIRDTSSQAWAPGQVKFTLNPAADDRWGVDYLMGDHSPRTMGLAQVGKGDLVKLYGEDMVVYLRRKGADTDAIQKRIWAPDSFSLERLSDDTLLLRLPNFFADNRATIEGLLEEHHEALTTTENLIIDARNNNGGSDGAYSELMRYIYSRPIYAVGIEFLSSERNIAGFEDLLEQYGDQLDEDTREYVVGKLDKARAAPGEWIIPLERGFSITTYPEVMPYPRRVGILAENAGSSGDQFVIDARFSKKVTTFGKPTAGVIDYSNVIEAPLPSGNFAVSWPTTRSLRLPDEPYDNVGVPPDVPFGEEVADPIGYVQAWLERQVD